MGYYIETGANHGKAYTIAAAVDNAEIVDSASALLAVNNPNLGVIVVVDNGPFEAAAFAFDELEFKAFTDPKDSRPKQFVVMPRSKAEELSGYR